MFLVAGIDLRPPTVVGEAPREAIVGEEQIEDRRQPFLHPRVENGHDGLDPSVEVPRHHVGGADEPRRCVMRAAVGELPYAGVFEKSPHDTTYAYVLGEAGNSGTETADPPNDQVDRDARLGGFVERGDDLLVNEAVHLHPYPSGATLLGRHLVADHLQHAGTEIGRCHQQTGEGRHLAETGECVEQPRYVVAELMVGGEETDVVVDARGDRVVVPCCYVYIATKLRGGFATDDKSNLGVRLEPNQSVDDMHPGPLELSRPRDVRLFIKASLEFDESGDLFSCLGCVDECLHHRRLARCSVQGELDGEHIRVGGGSLDELLDRR